MIARWAILLAVCTLAIGPGRASASLPTRAPIATFSRPFVTDVFVSRLDPVTLVPHGPRVDLQEFHDGYSFSPDGRQIAFGKSPAGGNSRDGIKILDVAGLKVVQTVRTNIFVGALAWLAPHRLVGLLDGLSPQIFDPATAQVVARPAGVTTAGCQDPQTAVAGGALLGVGNRGLFSIDSAGRTRLARFGVGDCLGTGLTVDRGSAWVLPRNQVLEQVDLRTMRVTRHALTGPTPPPRYDNQLLGLPGGRLAVGHESRAGARGVELIDTRTDVRRGLDGAGGAVRLAGGMLLVYDGPRIGVRGYGQDGRLRFQLLRGTHVNNVQVLGRFAYAMSGRGLAVIDLRTKRVVHRSRSVRNLDIRFLSPNAR